MNVDTRAMKTWTAISPSAMMEYPHSPMTNPSPSSNRCDGQPQRPCRYRSAVLTLAQPQAAAARDFAAERRAMVDEITATVRETRSATGKQDFDERVLICTSSVSERAGIRAHFPR